MYFDRNFGLRLSLSESPSPLCDSLSEIILLFDLSLDLDRILAQREAQQKAKSKVKVTHCYDSACHCY